MSSVSLPGAQPWTRRQWAVLAGVVTLGLATVAAVVGTVSGSGGPGRFGSALSAPLSTTGATANNVQAFVEVARRPAAAPPMRPLPNVDLASVSASDIPSAALVAYNGATRQLAQHDGGCHLRWWLLAAIGFVESDHGAAGGSTSPGWDGVARPPIYGGVLDGSGSAPLVRDTDHGAFDGDAHWDRAVGEMQFLPSAWQKWGGPGPVAGHANPQEIGAASFAAGRFLCAAGGDLSQPRAMAVAVYSYNHSFDYTRLVLSVGAKYGGLAPNALGVDTLPTDAQVRPAKPGRARPAAPRQSATSQPTTASTAQPTTPPPTTTRPSGHPSPTASSSPSPRSSSPGNPLPSLTPPHSTVGSG